MRSKYILQFCGVLRNFSYFHFLFQIRALDQGSPQRSATTRVTVQVAPIPAESLHPPQIKTVDQQVQITESDKAKYLVALIQASDEDGDKLWFDIIGRYFLFLRKILPPL